MVAQITLDCARLLERREAHAYLAEALDLPEYYGRNLDALFDCLTEMGDCTLTLTGAEALRAAMAPGYPVTVLLETMAGKGSELGGSFQELRAILDAVGREDLGVCLDTCHVWDAGYDLAGDLDGVLREFDAVIGLSRLKALHLNDSKNPRGSRKDRHAPIGCLGVETFRAIVNHPALRDKPMILETPNELPGYRAEIALLRSLDAKS